MRIGCVYFYKKSENSIPRLVYIISGEYAVNGRISNFWNFRYIDESGKVSNRTGGDYDNASYKFKPATGYNVQIKIVKRKE